MARRQSCMGAFLPEAPANPTCALCCRNAHLLDQMFCMCDFDLSFAYPLPGLTLLVSWRTGWALSAERY